MPEYIVSFVANIGGLPPTFLGDAEIEVQEVNGSGRWLFLGRTDNLGKLKLFFDNAGWHYYFRAHRDSYPEGLYFYSPEYTFVGLTAKDVSVLLQEDQTVMTFPFPNQYLGGDQSANQPPVNPPNTKLGDLTVIGLGIIGLFLLLFFGMKR